MRTSAAAVAFGLAMIAAQVAFSDGAEPNLVPLPIGTIPVAVGSIALVLGLLLGIVFGNRRYRVAVALALVGGALLALGSLFLMTTGGPGRRPAVGLPDIAAGMGMICWVVAAVMGAKALRQPAEPDDEAGVGLGVSAGLVAFGVLLVVPLYLVSDLARVPVQIGTIIAWVGPTAVFAGLLFGIVFGNRLYRAGIVLALIGSLAAFIPLEFSFVSSIALWIAALSIGGAALLAPTRAVTLEV